MTTKAGVGAIAELSVVLFFFSAECHSSYHGKKIDLAEARKLSQQVYEAKKRNGVNGRNE